jgi:HD-like signal output (HDOD) protein
MDTSPISDKTGAALNEQRFQMLQDIAGELAGEVVFPTTFDLVIRLRKVLQDPKLSIDQVVAFVSLEPLMSARLISLANSAAFASTGKAIRSVHDAVYRLGLNNVRSCAMSIAMGQLLRAKEMVGFDELAQKLWQHSLHAASATYVVSQRLAPKINPDDAMLAGLVHDLGAFYMLYRATHYDELRQRPDTVKYLILQWHESIGHALLIALGVPEDVAEAAREHDQPRQVPPKPRNLTDVVYAGNLLAGGIFAWLGQDATATAELPALSEEYRQLGDEIEAHLKEMRSVFA